MYSIPRKLRSVMLVSSLTGITLRSSVMMKDVFSLKNTTSPGLSLTRASTGFMLFKFTFSFWQRELEELFGLTSAILQCSLEKCLLSRFSILL
ncbi:hypothetical protein Hanom_Chr10g00897551 [Helianthus anomalus]